MNDIRLIILILLLILFFSKNMKRAYLVLVVFFILIFLSKILSFYSGNISGVDFSHYDYAMWNTFRSNTPLLNVSIQDDSYYASLLGNHFSLILFFPGLIVQMISSHLFTVMLAPISLLISIYYLRKILIDIFKFSEEDTSLFSIAFLGMHYLTKVIDFEFHVEIFYIPILFALFFYMYSFLICNIRSNFYKFLITFFLCLFVKEDAPIILLSFFMAFILDSKNTNKKLPFLFIVLCIVYYVVVSKLFMPYFQKATSVEQSSYLGFWKKYGNTMIAVVKGAIEHPQWVFHDFVTSKVFYKLYYPLLFLPFYSIYFILPILYLAMMFTAIAPVNELNLYYSAPALPLIFIAFLFGIKKIQGNTHYLKVRNLILILCLTSGLGTYKFSKINFNLPKLTQNVNEHLDKIEKISKQPIFITGNLLPVVNYSSRLRRLYSLADFKREDVGAFIIAKKMDSYPLTRKIILENIDKLRISSTVFFEDEDLIVITK